MGQISKASIWVGRGISTLVVLFLVFDATIKLMKIEPVIEASTRLGISIDMTVQAGLILLACVLLYLIPKTAALGAIFLTGYLGGAVAIHLRAGSPLFGESMIPVYFGILVWVGLYLRDERVRGMLG